MSLKKAWKLCIGVGVVFGVVAVAGVTPVTARNQRPSANPYGNFNFRVEIDGVDAGQFTAVDGLSIEQEIIEYTSGAEPNIIRKLPGKVKYGNLTLKRGVVSGDTLWDWIQASFNADGDIPMKDGVLILEDHRGNEITRYNFYNAWPAKWQGPIFNASANDVAIEEIVLAVEGFEEVVASE